MDDDSGPDQSPMPLLDFFNKYLPEFEYNADESVSTEFARLYRFKRWPSYATVKVLEERDLAHEDFKKALTMQFNVDYGTDANNIGSWQTLCMYIGVQPIPETLKKCRDTVLSTHVNLVDMVDAFHSGQKVEVFDSVRELSKYTRRSKKVFPKINIHTGDLLRKLLRHIGNPARDDNRGVGGSTRRRSKRKKQASMEGF